MTPDSGPASSGVPATVVAAGAGDLDALSLVIAEAFHDLPPSRWLIPDPAARRAIFPAYFRLYAEHALIQGTVHTTPGRTAAALWIPTGPGSAAQPAGYHARLAALTGRWVSRFLAFDAALERHHPADTPYAHLAILAVRPDAQGQGIGTALLRAHHAVLDHDGIPAYLEAGDRRTRRLYLRHGYADYRLPIELTEGPQMYPMIRAVSVGLT